jgi:hypothetical protein
VVTESGLLLAQGNSWPSHDPAPHSDGTLANWGFGPVAEEWAGDLVYSVDTWTSQVHAPLIAVNSLHSSHRQLLICLFLLFHAVSTYSLHISTLLQSCQRLQICEDVEPSPCATLPLERTDVKQLECMSSLTEALLAQADFPKTVNDSKAKGSMRLQTCLIPRDAD